MRDRSSVTQQWLVTQQQPDGSWKPDANFINGGATNCDNNDVLRITAYWLVSEEYRPLGSAVPNFAAERRTGVCGAGASAAEETSGLAM